MTMRKIDWRIILEAPFAPTPDETILIALRLAGLRKGEQFYDLGSGDGRVLIAASKDFGAASVGFEVQHEMVEETMAMIHDAGLETMVTVLERDFFYEDLSKADVVFLYQTPSVLTAIAKKLVRELRSGSRIIAFRYPIKGWTSEIFGRDSSKHEIFLYRIP
jgi:precorrin-6B methylase 2